MVLDGSVGTATVTTQGPHRRLRHDAKGGDIYLATSGDLNLATSGDFFMATDNRIMHRLSDRLPDWLHSSAAIRSAAKVRLSAAYRPHVNIRSWQPMSGTRRYTVLA